MESGSPLWIALASLCAVALGNVVKSHLARTRKPTPPGWEHPVQALFRKRRGPAPKLLTDQRGNGLLLSRDSAPTDRATDQP
jgi:hypothetical protein